MLNYARKVYLEHDYEAIYDYLLHDDRKSYKQAFIEQESRRLPCTTGEISGIQLQQEYPYWNMKPVKSPSGRLYSPMQVTSHRIQITCATGSYEYAKYVNITIDTTKAAGFLPDTHFNDW